MRKGSLVSPGKASTFWDQTLPEPGSAEATPFRIWSSAIITVFLICSCYLAFTSDVGQLASHWHDENWLGGWIYADGRVPSLLPGAQIWSDTTRIPLVSEEDEDADDLHLDEPEDSVNATIKGTQPDFDRYVWHRDLKWEPATASGRLIIVGDIHGQIKSFEDLLKELHFDNTTDTLVLVGDLVAKAPNVQDSVAVVAYAREIGAKAVRGNHDQRVINFRLWQEWNGAYALGSESEADQETLTGSNTTDWLDAESEPTTLRAKLPKGWKWRSQHFEIARRLSPDDFHWMLKRSLTLHLRSLHAYVVHAGMLPVSIPRSSLNNDDAEDRNDYESSLPDAFEPTPDTESRMTADDAVLLKSQNKRPFTLLEMRGVTRGGTRPHSDGHRGTPWSKIWDDAMHKCESPKHNCRALDVVYGHWAARGLQIGQHTLGLDTGCYAGRALSALVLPGAQAVEMEYDKSLQRRPATLGKVKGTIFSIRCKKA